MSTELGVYGLETETETFENVVQALLTALNLSQQGSERSAHAERVAQSAVWVARHMGGRRSRT